jgi:hypothetical protein
MMETSSRIDWVLPNHDLAQRLDRMWSGETWRNDDNDGLAATLDAIPEWSGWDSWATDRQVEELERLLFSWEQPAEPAASSAEPVAEDTSQPRWNPNSGFWEVYNADHEQWWAHDADTGMWFDPAAQQWIPRHADDGAAAEPAGGDFDWVTPEQERSLAAVYGQDWAGALTQELDTRWGSGWQHHPAEHKQTWLADLLPALTESVLDGEPDDEAAPAVDIVDLDDLADEDEDEDEEIDDEDPE